MDQWTKVANFNLESGAYMKLGSAAMAMSFYTVHAQWTKMAKLNLGLPSQNLVLSARVCIAITGPCKVK